jgi:hypothetical protein
VLLRDDRAEVERRDVWTVRVVGIALVAYSSFFFLLPFSSRLSRCNEYSSELPG